MTPITVLTTELPEAKAKLEIEISADLVEDRMKHAAEHMAEQVKIPGFRQGKVPADLALQRLGPDAVFEHAFDESVSAWYAEALRETEIAPVGSPSLSSVPQYKSGEPLKFDLEVPVRPEAEVGDYAGIEVGKRDAAFDKAVVDAEIETLRERFGTLAQVDRAAKAGDSADIDFVGRLDGVEFEGGAGNDYVLELGSGQFIPGFEEQIIGAAAGDTIDVNVTFPEDYQAEHLAGKEVVFAVKVNAVKEKEFPELTDEFAKENLGYDTLQELRDEIETKAKEQAESEVEREYRWAVVDAVAKQAKMDIPQGHIHSRSHELWQELAMSLSQRGMDPRLFLQAQGKTEHEFIEGAEGDAELTLRRESVIATLIDELKIELTEEQMIAEIAADMKEGEESAREQYSEIEAAGGMSQLEAELKSRKVIDHLVEQAKPIPIEQAEARDAIWTPEKGEAEAAKQDDAAGGLWTPDS